MRNKGTKTGLECISVVMWRGRLRWFSHVKRMGDGNWVKRVRSMKAEGVSAQGRQKKTWYEVIQKDHRNMGWNREAARDGAVWRATIRYIGLAHASMEGALQNDDETLHALDQRSRWHITMEKSTIQKSLGQTHQDKGCRPEPGSCNLQIWCTISSWNWPDAKPTNGNRNTGLVLHETCLHKEQAR